MATLRLPSGEMRLVRAECRATIGVDAATPSTRTSRSARPAAAATLGVRAADPRGVADEPGPTTRTAAARARPPPVVTR